MINNLFLTVLNMSVAATYVIIFVLIARIFLKKSPKIFSYILWSVVLVRLLCPLSFESEFSLIPHKIQDNSLVSEWANEYVGKINIFHDNTPEYEDDIKNGNKHIPSGNKNYYGVTGEDGTSFPKTVEKTILQKLSYIWALGVLFILAYNILEFIKLKRNLIIAMPFKDNIYIVDHISTPFVSGFFRPRIYLPSFLTEKEQKYIIKHELCHIKRLDHITRVIGFIALSIHWFNPFVWIAFCLSGKDMEMSCDESVMNSMDDDVKAEYSNLLLRFSTSSKIIHSISLAFGEGDTKSRIKNILNYKKPIFGVSLLTATLVLLTAFGLLSNPKIEEKPPILYAYSENGVIPMNLGAYSWNGVDSDSISYTQMEYDKAISYNDGGYRNANIFLSMSSTPSDFNTDNIKGKHKFKIVGLKRYVNGKEETLKEFDDSMILVRLETDTSYLYEFKVQFGENYAYYSIKINNNVIESNSFEPLTNDQAIVKALKAESEVYLEGECFGEGHIILGTEQKEDIEKIYTLTMVGNYGFQNGNLVKVSGSGVIPAIITLHKNNYVEIEYPKDGNRYEESINEMFPKRYRNRIFKEKESDIENLKKQERAYAEKYLKQINRNASVGNYGDFEHILLTDVGVSVEVSNHLLEDFYKFNYKYPYFIGTQEYLENDERVVYELSYDEKQKQIIFTKYSYDYDKMIEKFIFDAVTGESIK